MSIPASRTQVRRLFVLDQVFRSMFPRKRYRSVAELAEEVNDAEEMRRAGVSIGSKTIQRDINLLRELGAPLKYDYERRRYYYTAACWAMPVFNLTESDLLLLFVAERMAEQLKGPPVARTLGGLGEKLRQNVLEGTGIDPDEWRQLISFHGFPTRPVNEAIWTQVFQAVRNGLKIRIDYQPVQSEGSGRREVEPVHLAWVEGEWYLVAWDPRKRGMRHFAPSGIKSVEVLDELCEPRNFNPDKYFANRFGRFIGPADKTWNVVLRFSKAVAPEIRQRQWHTQEKKEDHRDGSLTLSFPAPSLLEVQRWVLRWGGDVKVIAPKELRLGVLAAAREILRRHRRSEDKTTA